MEILAPKIGLVSGVGPLAGSDVLAKIFKNAAQLYGAVEDCEYPDVILVNHGIMGVDNTGRLTDLFEKEITGMVHQLEEQSATIIGIACNTAHIYLPNIKVKPATTLVNLIDTVAMQAKRQKLTHLLLTSSASRQQKLYHSYLDTHGVVYTEVAPGQQQLLDEAIGLVMAHHLERAGAILEQIVATAQANGFEGIIAGCTELPVALAHCKNVSGLQIIDSNDELAKALLKYYYAVLKKSALKKGGK